MIQGVAVLARHELDIWPAGISRRDGALADSTYCPCQPERANDSLQCHIHTAVAMRCESEKGLRVPIAIDLRACDLRAYDRPSF